MEPQWMMHARKYLGLREIVGAKHNPTIVNWWAAIRSSWFKDDETPWCAAFVGGVLEECGIVSSRSAAARSYLKWGVRVAATPGAICVLSRPGSPGAGHVFFIVGRSKNGHIVGLGGNQGNMVGIDPFDYRRVLDMRWPATRPEPKVVGFDKLPLVDTNGKPLSRNEA